MPKTFRSQLKSALRNYAVWLSKKADSAPVFEAPRITSEGLRRLGINAARLPGFPLCAETRPDGTQVWDARPVRAFLQATGGPYGDIVKLLGPVPHGRGPEHRIAAEAAPREQYRAKAHSFRLRPPANEHERRTCSARSLLLRCGWDRPDDLLRHAKFPHPAPGAIDRYGEPEHFTVQVLSFQNWFAGATSSVLHAGDAKNATAPHAARGYGPRRIVKLGAVKSANMEASSAIAA